MDFNFWKGKKVLVTGHTGFKGSWLVKWLSMLGAEIYGWSIDELPIYKLLGINNLCKSDTTYNNLIQIDTPNVDGVEIIFHLAAQPIVSVGYADPLSTFQDNIMGTVALYEACKDADNPPKVIVTITTDKVYAQAMFPPSFDETSRLGGDDPYSCSKACVELITECYKKSFFDKAGIKVTTARAGNVIGGGDWAENRILPDIIRARNTKKHLTVRNLSGVRPFQHVLDPLHGYLILAEKLYNGVDLPGAFNFGPETSHTVAAILEFAGFTDYQTMGATFSEAPSIKLDCTRAKNLLNWAPLIDVPTAVKNTIEEYDNFHPGFIEDRINWFMGKINNA